MNSNFKPMAQASAWPDLDCAAMLQSEIEFWQEVIATCPVKQSAESLERMHQALALAETRLARVSQTAVTTPFSPLENDKKSGQKSVRNGQATRRHNS